MAAPEFQVPVALTVEELGDVIAGLHLLGLERLEDAFRICSGEDAVLAANAAGAVFELASQLEAML